MTDDYEECGYASPKYPEVHCTQPLDTPHIWHVNFYYPGAGQWK